MTEQKLEGNPLTRYRVGIVWQYLEELTIYAHSMEEAVASVREGYGKHAGAYPPVIGEILVKEIGGFDNPEEEAEYEAKKSEATTQRDDIEVISDEPIGGLIVPPSGV